MGGGVGLSRQGTSGPGFSYYFLIENNKQKPVFFSELEYNIVSVTALLLMQIIMEMENINK